MVQTVCCRLPTAYARPRVSMSGRYVLRFVMDRITQAWVLLSFQVLRFLPVNIIPQATGCHFHLNVLTCVFGRTSGPGFANFQKKALLFGCGKRMGKRITATLFCIITNKCTIMS